MQQRQCLTRAHYSIAERTGNDHEWYHATFLLQPVLCAAGRDDNMIRSEQEGDASCGAGLHDSVLISGRANAAGRQKQREKRTEASPSWLSGIRLGHAVVCMS